MSQAQKALVLRAGPETTEGLEELNIELERGWRVADVSPMGGAGGATSSPIVAALVILEYDDEQEDPAEVAAKAVGEAVEETVEDADDVVDEVVEDVDDVIEGDGADGGLPERP